MLKKNLPNRRSFYRSIICLTLALMISVVHAQQHFSFVSNTGNNMTVLIKSSIKPLLNNVPLAIGDEIGAFTPEGMCVGAIVWKGKNEAITIWGDNEQTQALDGARSGENLLFRIWSSQQNAECNAMAAFESGGPAYRPDGIAVLSTLAGNLLVSEQKVVPKINAEEAVPEKQDKIALYTSIHLDSNTRPDLGTKRSNPPQMLNTSQHRDSIPTSITLVEPAHLFQTTSDSVVLRWKRVEAKDSRYWLELSTDSMMTKAIIDSSLAQRDTCRTYHLRAGAYWWRVRDGKNGVWGPYSEKRKMEILSRQIKPGPFEFAWHPLESGETTCAIEYRLQTETKVKFNLIDSNEKPVLSFSKKQSAGPQRIPVDITNLRRGTYSYTLEIESFAIKGQLSVE